MLNELGLKYNTDKANEHFFCDLYEKFLPEEIDELWEIGILNGSSLQMWADYYKSAKIVGYDINDSTDISWYSNNIITKRLDQSKIDELNKLTNQSNIDIIVDDGSHIIEHQILTFETLFDSLKPHGIYILEDLHTSIPELHEYSDYTYGMFNNKGALQYLNDIILHKIPEGYPGQYKTESIIDSIESIYIFSNNKTNTIFSKKRSITSIIKHI